jgi:signal transduction histidine kinase
VSKIDLLVATARRPDARVVDAAAAVMLGVVVIATEISARHAYFVIVTGLVLSATVALRRRSPVVATLVAGAAATVIARSGAGSVAVSPAVFALDYYMVGRRRTANRWATWVDVVVLALPLVGIATDPSTPMPGNPLVVDVISVWAFFFAIPFAAGRAVRTRTSLNTALRANAERLEQQQRERARQAVVEERTRIARELHDVVAHSVSVMVIQTAAARAVAPRDRAAALEALRSVESCGRDALIDMRRMIGVLHRADIDLLGGAAPGLAQLDKLAERARASGLPVQVSVQGQQRPLLAGLDLVSFRVVQEALTNAIKHAGPARALVRVTFTADCLELEIVDTGSSRRRQRVSTDAPGHGLLGMRERLSLYGGQLQTGPRRGGGFQVLARIPLTEAVKM